MPVTTNPTAVDQETSSVEQQSASSAIAPESASTSRKLPKWKNPSPPPPTNCVVLKNLDYNITQITLEEVVRRVTGGRKEFVNIALIDDRTTGSFRGMAFVNFHTVSDATAALAELSKMVINGRKVIAEYRRLRPGEREKQEKRTKKFDHYNNNNRQTFEKDVQDTDERGVRVDKRVAFFAKRDTIRKVDEQKRNEEKAERDKEREADFRKRLLEYNAMEVPDGDPIEDIVFEPTLTSYERRMVHTICDELELGHISRFDEGGNRVLHVTKDPEKKVEWDKEAEAVKAAQKKEEAQKQKNKDNSSGLEWKKGDTTSGGPLTKDELHGIKWFKPRSAMAASGELGEAATNSGIRAPSYKLYVPPRQPSGPDGTNGFSSRSACRQHEEENVVPAENWEGEVGEEKDCTINENGDCSQDKKAEQAAGKSSSNSMLNPSVPPFSPSCTQTY